jgi:hypothetical protein
LHIFFTVYIVYCTVISVNMPTPWM